MGSHNVDCTGIDKSKLLETLWDNAKYSELSIKFQSFGIPKCNKPSEKEFISKSCGYISDIAGRTLYIDFTSFPYVDSNDYNSYNGEGLFQSIVNSFKTINTKLVPI